MSAAAALGASRPPNGPVKRGRSAIEDSALANPTSASRMTFSRSLQPRLLEGDDRRHGAEDVADRGERERRVDFHRQFPRRVARRGRPAPSLGRPRGLSDHMGARGRDEGDTGKRHHRQPRYLPEARPVQLHVEGSGKTKTDPGGVFHRPITVVKRDKLGDERDELSSRRWDYECTACHATFGGSPCRPSSSNRPRIRADWDVRAVRPRPDSRSIDVGASTGAHPGGPASGGAA